MNRVIEVTVSPNGEVTVRTQGYVGNTCQDASRFLEQALGTTTAERKTPEFFQMAEELLRQHH